ncbi:hypothetical protein J2Z48_002642 [Croceifilum oryzae]|uniref:Uncharacterized protein n=1 Tax=Croceifilum oryzae TaxID=1553429 RepID=A0AAJ1WT61_9BACL|nr:hypothetical protein [Croceifilum oryzae]
MKRKYALLITVVLCMSYQALFTFNVFNISDPVLEFCISLLGIGGIVGIMNYVAGKYEKK